MARRSRPADILLQELRVIAARRKRRAKQAPRIVKKAKGPGMTARQMLRRTPASYKERAQHVRVRKVKRKAGDNFALAVTTTERGHATEEQPHYQTVEIISPKGERKLFEPHTKLRISCDCSNFKFMWEYALWKQGAADIIYGNGERPRQTNPQQVPGLCKHFIAIFHFLRDRGERK